MPLLLKLIPLRDWLYLGLFLSLIAGSVVFVHHERQIGASHEAVQVRAASDKAEHDAQVKIDNLNKLHTSDVETIRGAYETQRKVDSDKHDSDAQRLREYDAYRRSHQTVGGPAAGPGAVPSRDGGVPSNDDRFSSLEQVALDLAAGGRSVLNSLNACRMDRDKLTGK